LICHDPEVEKFMLWLDFIRYGQNIENNKTQKNLVRFSKLGFEKSESVLLNQTIVASSNRQNLHEKRKYILKTT
jgi:hypothetical protein